MISINSALAAGDESIVCFENQGQTHNLAQLKHQICKIKYALSKHKGEHWAVNSDSPLTFLSGIIALWQVNKIPVLLPNQQAGTLKQLSSEFHGILANQPSAVAAPFVNITQEENAAELPLTPIPEQSKILVYTSGSTGVPKQEAKYLGQLEAEIRVLETTWGDKLADSRTYSTVSHQHIYGLLFRLLWPFCSGRSFANFNFAYPEQLAAIQSNSDLLVSSPALLKRLAQLEQAVHLRCVFSSGGPLPLASAQLAQEKLAFLPIEVLGSTETGGVAWRQQQDSTSPWRLMDTVQCKTDELGLLQVCSSFLPDQHWFTMGDRVELLPNRQLRLKGRGDRIVKIEEKRVSLTEIEIHLNKLHWVDDVMAIALELSHRQAIAVAVVLSATGKEAVSQLTNHQRNQHLLDVLRPFIEPIALPKKFRYLNEIPVNSQGKRQVSVIKELF